MGRTAYSSANRAYPFLQEESEPSEEEMQGRRDSHPRPTVLESGAVSLQGGGGTAETEPSRPLVRRVYRGVKKPVTVP